MCIRDRAFTTRSVNLVALTVTELFTIQDVGQSGGINFFVRKNSIFKRKPPFLTRKSKNRDAHGGLREKAKKVLKNHFIFFQFGETVVGREGDRKTFFWAVFGEKIHLKKVPIEGRKPDEGYTNHRP